jgi:hypothetical protein
MSDPIDLDRLRSSNHVNSYLGLALNMIARSKTLRFGVVPRLKAFEPDVVLRSKALRPGMVVRPRHKSGIYLGLAWVNPRIFLKKQYLSF